MHRVSLIMLLVLFLSVTNIQAQDYSELSPSGDLLNYTIVDNNAILKGRNDSVSSADPYIDLVIPTHITFNGVYMPVRIIAQNAFSNDYKIRSVAIPQTVKTIEKSAFSGCLSIGTIVVPPTVTSIKSNAFLGIPNVDYHGCADNNENIVDGLFWGAQWHNGYIVDGWCYADSTMKYLVHANRSVTKFTIPETVEEVYYNAYNGTMVDTLYIDPNIPMSEQFRFCNSLNLKVVFYNNTSRSYDLWEAFSNCKNLTEFNIGNRMTFLQIGICSDCSSLTEIYIPDNVELIHNNAFARCHNIHTVHVGDSVSEIRDGAFTGCRALRNLYIGKKVKRLFAFRYCDSLRHIVLPQSVETIVGAFSYCPNIESITCMAKNPPTVIESSDTAFMGCNHDIPIYVPCVKEATYAENWSMFHNIIEMPYYVTATSADETKGTAEMTKLPTCDDRYATVEAYPKQGYTFSHWSNGITQNPYTFKIAPREILCLTAYFRSTNAIKDAFSSMEMCVYVQQGQIVIENCAVTNVDVFDIYGRQIHHIENAYGVVKADVPSTGVYVIKNATGITRKCLVIKY